MKLLSVAICILGLAVSYLLLVSRQSDIQLDTLVRIQQSIVNVGQHQTYAKTVVKLSCKLADENLELRKTVSRARETVNTLDQELNATKNALNDSVKLLKEQIIENNKLREFSILLQQYIDQLITKVPDAPPRP